MYLSLSKSTLLFLLCFFCFKLPQHVEAKPSKPNVLLIITDDQGYGDITRHGNPDIKTPHLDQIATEGAYTDRFFVSPVCSPTRASVLTGRYHLRTGVYDVTRGHETMRSEEVTIAEILKANDYQTAAFGKWHNGAHYPEHPLGQGFDHFTGFCAGHWNNYIDSLIEKDGQPFQTKGFLIDVLTDCTLDYIKAQQDKSWFAYVAFNTPHTPWQVPDSFFYQDHLKNLAPETQCAYAMVENIDYNVGRLLKTLDELQLQNDTIVLFMTDNGANSDRYNAGMRGRKGSAHEGGSRVPLFIKYPPKIKPGTVVKGLSMHIDLLPTLVELTGCTMIDTKPLDGISLAPQLLDQNAPVPQRMLFTEWGHKPGGPTNKCAVRTNQYRLVKDGAKKEWMLFDMLADPGEEHDLAQSNPDLLAFYKKRYELWFKEVTIDGFDPIPIKLGLTDHPQVTLPAHEAILNTPKKEGIKYFGGNGFANDWISDWNNAEATASWPIKISSGNYEFILEYGCPVEHADTQMIININDKQLVSPKIPAFTPTDLPNHDRIHRKEVREKLWNKVSLGEMYIEKKYTGDLKLSCQFNKSPAAPDIKSLTVIKKK